MNITRWGGHRETWVPKSPQARDHFSKFERSVRGLFCRIFNSPSQFTAWEEIEVDEGTYRVTVTLVKPKNRKDG